MNIDSLSYTCVFKKYKLHLESGKWQVTRACLILLCKNCVWNS
jgi:hypothetical protein